MTAITELAVGDQITADLFASHVEGRVVETRNSQMFHVPLVMVNILGEAIARPMDNTWTYELVARPGAAA